MIKENFKNESILENKNLSENEMFQKKTLKELIENKKLQKFETNNTLPKVKRLQIIRIRKISKSNYFKIKGESKKMSWL